LGVIPVVGGTTASWAKKFTNERTVNWVPVVDEAGEYITALRGTAGLQEFVDLGTSAPVLGVTSAKGEIYTVSGGKLFKVTSGGTATEIGDLDIDGDQVSMKSNGIELFIACGGKGYTYTFATETLAQITDADFPGARLVDFMDGYFVFPEPSTGRFMVTALYDGDNVDALDFATAESSPDDVVSLIARKSDVILFGAETTEFHFNQGGTGFPFARNSGATLDIGCGAQYSPAKADNMTFWLGGGKDGAGGVFMIAGGYGESRISTEGLEEEFRSYDTVNDAIGYAYQENKHVFYVLTFPTERKTWVYDVSTDLWHERESYKQGRHKSNCYTFFKRQHIVGDYANGKLYYMDLDVYTDDGDPIISSRICKNISNQENFFTLPKFELIFQSGYGLTTGQGSDPQAMLSYSNDSGHTWSDERWRSFGKIGEYGHRAIWRKLGVSRNRMFKIEVSDPVKRNIIGAVS